MEKDITAVNSEDKTAQPEVLTEKIVALLASEGATVGDGVAALNAAISRLHALPVAGESCLGLSHLNSGNKGRLTVTLDNLASSLEALDTSFLADVLSKDQLQMLCIFVAEDNPRLAGSLIRLLPHDQQPVAVMAITDNARVAHDSMMVIIDEINGALTTSCGMHHRGKSGVVRVVEIFKHLDRTREKQILDRLDVMQPPLAEIIRKHLLTFEDIFCMDSRSIRGILREVSCDVLTLALKTCPEDIRERVFENVSSGAAEVIREDLEHMGPVRLTDVEMAQSEIIKIVRRMEEEGRIVIGRGGDDVLV